MRTSGEDHVERAAQTLSPRRLVVPNPFGIRFGLTVEANEPTSREWRMKEMTANDDLERFWTGAAKYAAYLETPGGRLRLDLTFANLQEFLPQATRSLKLLDLGCGTGSIAV